MTGMEDWPKYVVLPMNEAFFTMVNAMVGVEDTETEKLYEGLFQLMEIVGPMEFNVKFVTKSHIEELLELGEDVAIVGEEPE